MTDVKRIGFLLERTTRIAKLSFSRAFAALKLDITPEQWILIDHLSENGEMSQKELGDNTFKNAPTISRIIDNLVKKGLVSRVAGVKDRRKTSISLTAQGIKLVYDSKKDIENLRNHSWENLSEHDYQDFVRILDQIFNNFSKQC
ncbi:MAG: MarR family transcriptional regulator [Saprospiraceae bacterium]